MLRIDNNNNIFLTRGDTLTLTVGLTGVSLTANQKIRVYGRNSRGSSYYIYAPTLVIVEA